jgi:hypothetical protein
MLYSQSDVSVMHQISLRHHNFFQGEESYYVARATEKMEERE